MDRDTAVALLKGRLARWNDTVLTTHIQNELQAAQTRLEMTEPLPWFLLTESSYTTTVVGEERIETPADFIREADEDALWLTTSAGGWCKLRKDDYDYIRERWSDSGQPVRYALVGDYFRLRPVPDAVYTIRMIYFGRDAILDSNVENKWLKYASELMIAEAGAVIASRYVRNDVAATEFKADIVAARRNLLVANQARLDAGRVYMGDN